MDKCIAVDLDGTLARTTRDGSIGAPIKAMADRVKGWNKDGLSVVVFTARAGDPIEVRKIQAWLKQHGLPELDVTHIKDASMVEIWDNRAVRVKTDSGDVCGGCNSNRLAVKSISAKYMAGGDLDAIQTDC
ncbi:MAG: hypothetical protein KKG92_11225 [Gammaproteobacteria bacterium]|nr:hypothetical protein [Gammaproteobacteria bacterium]